MYRSLISRAPVAVTSRPVVSRLALRYASDDLTQGHATRKSQDPMHKDSDIQSNNVRKGKGAKQDASSSTGGDDQPLDAARLGGQGGEAKSAEGTGSFKDQVGGQPGQGKAGEMGGTEKTGSDTVMGKVKETFAGRHPTENRKFHTSAVRLNGTNPRADADGSRQPKDKDVKGDQNPHLKHTPGGSQGNPKGGNAAPDPHLPSQQKTSGSSSSGKGSEADQRRSFTTSMAVGSAQPPRKYAGTHVDAAKDAGYDVPPTALPEGLDSPYQDKDPNAVPPPPKDLKASTEVNRSSTASAPAHDTLSEAAKTGNLAERNAQPHPDAGRKGLGEAWKDRQN